MRFPSLFPIKYVLLSTSQRTTLVDDVLLLFFIIKFTAALIKL